MTRPCRCSAPLQQWIERSAQRCRLLRPLSGAGPAENSCSGGGVQRRPHHQRTGLLIHEVGRDATADELTTGSPHEMVNLALPELGVATIGSRKDWPPMSRALRARSSAIATSATSGGIPPPMPLGLPRTGEGGMDQTRPGAHLLGRRPHCLGTTSNAHKPAITPVCKRHCAQS